MVAAYLLAGAVLCAVYTRLSQTYPLNSDSANILLMGSDLLHGNVLLHNWYMSDVSFYPTEIPQYALLEAFLGMSAETAHIAAAMTYTLALLLAVMLARSGPASSGRQRLIRTLVAAGIMLAPQLGLGVFTMDLSVGHIGTAVPLLLIWLLLDRADPLNPHDRDPASLGHLCVLVAILLAWVLVADPIVYIVGVGPLGIVSALRVIRGWVKADGNRSQGYDLALGATSLAAAGLAWFANGMLAGVGGYTVAGLPFHLTPWSNLHNNWQAGWKVLTVFGADYTGLSGIQLVLAFLHLASVALVACALARVAWRFFRVSLVDQILAVAIVLNVLLFMFTNASGLAAHEVAIIVPFGAVLAARVLVREPNAVHPASRARRVRLAGGLRLAGAAVGILVLIGYAAGLGYEIRQPARPAANVSLATWLFDHHLTYGLSGYWTSSSVTVDSDNQVQVRALQPSMQDYLWMSSVSWYDPQAHDADFIVLDSTPGYTRWEPPVWLIKKYFGRPARIYHTGPYTVLVWHKNLLLSVPGNSAIQALYQ